ncbi:hypothetical protein [Aquisalibacillus elongatus]|uniref:ABC-2 family transporter n=1 Tax=Aquisalibacillus elongatus TaxID=485577 RepID=A0A3N5B8S3_9BACI|nr:hypothetical protein [Aquisalibacillus elongatus]RPF53379.1 hypothetical protein EDC24_1878 [Aquisalibacillus elongatus]
MSLNSPSLKSTVIKQSKYKWMSYKSAFQSLIVVQIISILFTLLGAASGTSSFGLLQLHITYSTGDVILFFTFIWAFFTGLSIDRKENRLADQIFVTNQVSRHLANIVFLILINLVGMVTLVMAGFAIKLIIFWYKGPDQFLLLSSYSTSELLLVLGMVFLYLTLLSSIGYAIGSIVRLSKVVKVVVITTGVALVFLGDERVGQIISFYGSESSIVWFIGKVLVSSFLAFGLAYAIARQSEVRS